MIDNYKNITFFRQRIVRKKGVHMLEEGEEYELLLRNENNGNTVFPNTLIEEAIVNHLEHRNYLKKIEYLLVKILKNCSGIYSINIDTQELYYEETLQLFDHLKKYRKKLKIELTETLPYKREGKYSNQFPIERVIKLYKMGYKIVLDDFLSGINGMDKLITLSPYISRVKISKLIFGTNFSDTLFCSFIFTIDKLIHEINTNLTLVIEAEEKEEMLAKLPDNWYYQTFYFDKPSSFLTKTGHKI